MKCLFPRECRGCCQEFLHGPLGLPDSDRVRRQSDLSFQSADNPGANQTNGVSQELSSAAVFKSPLGAALTRPHALAWGPKTESAGSRCSPIRIGALRQYCETVALVRHRSRRQRRFGDMEQPLISRDQEPGSLSGNLPVAETGVKPAEKKKAYFKFSPRILDHLGISAYNSVQKCLSHLCERT
jgi:hypothetical protein